MNSKKIVTLLTLAAVVGNVLFILWMLFNAIDEGFKATVVEKFSCIGLICLLAMNSMLLVTRRSGATT